MSTSQPQSPFLREQRDFPWDNLPLLGVELDKSYIDIAQRVNTRVVGLYTTNKPTATGENWYLTGGNTRQQGLRQVYQFTGSGNIPHAINWSSVSMITHSSGFYTDGTNWYGAIYSSDAGIAGQVTFYVTPVNIVVTVDAAAPVPTSGTIILEWVSVF